MVYLDNSATTFIKPANVKNAVNLALNKYSVNPGRGSYSRSEELSSLIFKARKNIDNFFGGFGEEKVIFLNSCTAALNSVLFGYLNKGNHVIVSDMEHNAVMRPLYKLKEKGVEFSVAKTYPCDHDKTVNSYRHEIKKNTKLIIATAASNVWGLRLPIERLAALSNLYGIKICVDAAQAAGLTEINMKENGIEFLCLPSHKALYGIMGLGVLLIKDHNNLEPLIYGGTGVNSISFSQPELPPEKYESGTLNVPAVLSLSEGINFVRSKGTENIRKNEIKKLQFIYDNLKNNKKIKFYTERPDEYFFTPVLSFNTEKEPEKMGEEYNKLGIALRCGLHCAPEAHRKFGTIDTGTVRISPSYFTTQKECDFFIDATERIMRKT